MIYIPRPPASWLRQLFNPFCAPVHVSHLDFSQISPFVSELKRLPVYASEVLWWASVRLSVRPSVKRVHCDKTKARSEKSSIMTNRKSPTSFPMSLRWTEYVAPNPQRGPQKRIFLHFQYKQIGLLSKKVCYKVSLCENFQRQSCTAFTGLSSRAQMVGGGRPLLPEILGQSNPPLQKTATSNIFARSDWTIAPRQKVQLSLIGIPLRDFQWA